MQKKITTKVTKNIIYIAISLIIVFGLNFYFSLNYKGMMGSCINIFLFATNIIVIKKCSLINRRTMKFSWIFAAFFALSMVIGKVLKEYGTIRYCYSSPAHFLNVLVMMIGLALFIGLVIGIIINAITKRIDAEVKLYSLFTSRYFFFIVWGAIFLLWIPCILAFYPGNYSFDIPWQTLSKRFHPLLHTGFWMICVNLGSIIGIDATLIYAIIQMAVLSAAFAKIILFMTKYKMPNWSIIIAFLFLSINPCMSLLAISTTKDVFFAVVMILLTIKIFELILSRKENIKSTKDYIIMGVLMLLVCFLRNNAAYALLATAPFIILTLKKQWKQVVITITLSLSIYFVFNGPILTYMGVEKTSTVEMLSVPLQQTANMVSHHYKDMDKKDQEIIDDLMNHHLMKEKYMPEIADNIKFNMNVNHKKSIKDYLNVWVKYLKIYPSDYIDAFLKLNLTTWAPDTKASKGQLFMGYLQISETNQKDIDYDHYFDKYTIHRDSKIPFLRKIYKKIMNSQPFSDVPILSTIFYLSFPLWFLLFCATILVVRKRKEFLVALMPGFWYLATSVIGPASLARYVFPVLVLCPIYITVACISDNKTKSNKELIALKRENI